MNPKKSLSLSLGCPIIALLAATSAQAITYYWDNNGAPSGFGSAGGTWTNPTVSQWSTGTGASTGVATPGASVTTTTSDALHFGTDTATYGLGSGTITVSGTVNAASLRFGSQTTGNVFLSGGTINLGAVTSIHVGAGGSTVHTISSSITGAGTSLTKTGNTLTLSGDNSYSGTTIISTGNLVLGHLNALGNTTGVTIGGASTATLSSTLTGITISAPITTANTGITSTISFGRGTAAVGSLTLDGAIGGNGNVTFTTPNNNSGGNVQTINLGATGTWAGNTTMTTGNSNNATTIKNTSGAANVLPITTVLTMSGGSGTGSGRAVTFDLNGQDQELAGLQNTTAADRDQRVTSATAATLTINNSADYTFGNNTGGADPGAGQITGAIALTKKGTGTFTLAAGIGHTYTGATTINGGGLQVQHANALGSTAAGTTVNGSGTPSGGNARLELAGGISTNAGESLTISGAGNFNGALTSTSGNNKWQGAVTIGSAGTRIGASTSATLEVSGVIDSGVVSTGLNIRTANTTDSTVILSGANTYLGDTTLVVGKLQIAGGNDRLPVGTTLRLTGTTLANSTEFDLNGFNQEVAGITLGGGNAAFNSVNNSSEALALSTLTVNTASSSPSTYGGILKGNLALTKTGTGSLTLTGTSNTYTGATNVNQGTLIVDGNISTSVLTTISDTATLGGGGVVGDLVFQGGSFFDIFDAVDNADSLASTTITFSTSGFGIDNLVSQGAVIDWSTIANGTYTLITGTLDDANLGNFGLANAYDIGGGRSAYFAEGSLQLVVIPEPGVAWLGGIGLSMLTRRRRR